MSRKRGCPRCNNVVLEVMSLGLFDHGSGRVECRKCRGSGRLRDGALCHPCNGSGRVDCARCRGTGFVGGRD